MLILCCGWAVKILHELIVLQGWVARCGAYLNDEALLAFYSYRDVSTEVECGRRGERRVESTERRKLERRLLRDSSIGGVNFPINHIGDFETSNEKECSFVWIKNQVSARIGGVCGICCV